MIFISVERSSIGLFDALFPFFIGSLPEEPRPPKLVSIFSLNFKKCSVNRTQKNLLKIRILFEVKEADSLQRLNRSSLYPPHFAPWLQAHSHALFVCESPGTSQTDEIWELAYSLDAHAQSSGNVLLVQCTLAFRVLCDAGFVSRLLFSRDIVSNFPALPQEHWL